MSVLDLAPSLLAYRPFLDPMALGGGLWWLTLLPLAFGVSVVYKAVRMPSLDRYWAAVLTMTAQIVVGIVGLALGLYLLVEWAVPLLGR